MDNPFRVKRIHTCHRFPLISELPVRAIFDDEKTMLAGKFHKHHALGQLKRLAGRILEIRNHVEELYLLSLRYNLVDCGLESLAISLQISNMGHTTDIRTIGAEGLQGSQIRRI